MASPVAGLIQLPLDTGNTGKKKRTTTKVVGADTVHIDHVIVDDDVNYLGKHKVHSGILTIPTAAHNGTTTGHLFFFNPVGNTYKARITRLRETGQVVAGAVDLTAPRQLFARFTFTGTPSGALITPAKRATSDGASTCSLRTASTGATITLGAIFRHTGVPSIVATASSATVQTMFPPCIYPPYDPEEGEAIELVAGEGVVLYSADASTTANRRLFSDWAWEEFE
jgi:hypothetical protein